MYRPKPPPTWQYVNFSESLNREGIIYPSVLFKHSSILIHCDVEKQSETCLSVAAVINNVGLLLFCLMCAIQISLLFTLVTKFQGFGFFKSRDRFCLVCTTVAHIGLSARGFCKGCSSELFYEFFCPLAPRDCINLVVTIGIMTIRIF